MVNRAKAHAAAVSALVLVVTAGARGQTADGPAAPPPAEPTVQQLVGELGSPVWRDREVAYARLEQMGSSINDELRKAFLAAPEYDVRHRIRHLAHEIYLDENIGPIRAFLGIQHQGYDSLSNADPRIPPGMTGIGLSMVIWGSAASQAGLRPGDVIIALDGRRGTLEKPASGFLRWIGDQMPGTTCTLTVLRGGSGTILANAPGETPHLDPRGFAKAESHVVGAGEDPRVPPDHAGIVLDDVSKVDRRLKLENGDLILGLDGEALLPQTAMERFRQWCEQSPAPALPEERGGARNPVFNRGGAGPAPKPSVQIMRGGRIKDFEVTLMARPANLNDGRSWQRGQVSQAKLRAADAAFDAMWERSVGESAPVCDRKDAAPVWRMDEPTGSAR